MTRRSLFATLTTAAVLAVAAAAPAAFASPAARQTYIVVLRDGVSVDRAVAAHGRAYGLEVRHTYRYALSGYAAVMSSADARALASDPRVLSVAPDRVVSIDAQTVPTGIDRIDGELSSTASGDGSGTVDVDVAVIDTGIDVDHPDLNVMGGKNCVQGKPTIDDGNGHGTHVAGTIAAKDDGQGVVGVVPGARLWAVRVLNNNGSGTWSGVICGIDWVTSKASTIEVANMSLGGSGTEPSASGCSTGDGLHDAICKSVRAGVTYAVAAGNASDDAAKHVPAAYDEVITVSALADFDGASGGGAAPTCRTDEDDTFANFSNYGADVDIIAPGVCINSTWKGNSYNTISGTSMATPHVAGAAALYKASNASASPAQVQTALQSAGNLDWNNVDDRDTTKEVLLNVSAF